VVGVNGDITRTVPDMPVRVEVAAEGRTLVWEGLARDVSWHRPPVEGPTDGAWRDFVPGPFVYVTVVFPADAVRQR
jgi:hypothetical protein